MNNKNVELELGISYEVEPVVYYLGSFLGAIVGFCIGLPIIGIFL